MDERRKKVNLKISFVYGIGITDQKWKKVIFLLIFNKVNIIAYLNNGVSELFFLINCGWVIIACLCNTMAEFSMLSGLWRIGHSIEQGNSSRKSGSSSSHVGYMQADGSIHCIKFQKSNFKYCILISIHILELFCFSVDGFCNLTSHFNYTVRIELELCLWSTIVKSLFCFAKLDIFVFHFHFLEAKSRAKSG